MSVKRYSISLGFAHDCEYCELEKCEDSDAEWVKYADYAALEKHTGELEFEQREWRIAHHDLQAKYAALEAERDALRACINESLWFLEHLASAGCSCDESVNYQCDSCHARHVINQFKKEKP